MNDTFMKEKPIFPLLVSMALPMVISMLVNALYNIVDSLFVAQISEDAMTALSLVYPVQNLINAIAIGFGVGINAQIALHLGAGEHKKANMAATHGLMLSLLHGHHGGQHPDHADLPEDVHQRRNGHPDGRDLLAHRVPVLHGHHGHPGI